MSHLAGQQRPSELSISPDAELKMRNADQAPGYGNSLAHDHVLAFLTTYERVKVAQRTALIPHSSGKVGKQICARA